MSNTIEHPATLIGSRNLVDANREVTGSDLKKIQKNNFVSTNNSSVPI